MFVAHAVQSPEVYTALMEKLPGINLDFLEGKSSTAPDASPAEENGMDEDREPDFDPEHPEIREAWLAKRIKPGTYEKLTNSMKPTGA